MENPSVQKSQVMVTLEMARFGPVTGAWEAAQFKYGGQYKTTDGFQQAECSSDIQSSNKIGFWCDWNDGDGSVMMIGGGGSGCNRADHGIGITETNAASFVELGGAFEYDFGYDVAPGRSQSYSLDLWIR